MFWFISVFRFQYRWKWFFKYTKFLNCNKVQVSFLHPCNMKLIRERRTNHLFTESLSIVRLIRQFDTSLKLEDKSNQLWFDMAIFLNSLNWVMGKLMGKLWRFPAQNLFLTWYKTIALLIRRVFVNRQIIF